MKSKQTSTSYFSRRFYNLHFLVMHWTRRLVLPSSGYVRSCILNKHHNIYIRQFSKTPISFKYANEKQTWAERSLPSSVVPYVQLARWNRPAGKTIIF